MRRSLPFRNFLDQTLRVLHIYVGVLVAPFIFIAALTGTLYGLTPQIEKTLYENYLVAKHQSHQVPYLLSEQVQRAQKFVPSSAHIIAVRPAKDANTTTRVLYMDMNNPSQTTAIFINPYNLTMQGKLSVYGTSGILPMRTFLDHLHRDLLLGQYGRIYSELAASWLGIFAITGLIQWLRIKRKNVGEHIRRRSIHWHSLIGICVLPMLLFFSVTGLTWSNWAGGNIAKFRHWINSDTPSLNTQLGTHQGVQPDEHAEHRMGMMMHHNSEMKLKNLTDFDEILNIARASGLNAPALQIKPSYDEKRAWVIEELQHQWPIKIDALAVDIKQQKIIDRIYFKDFPLSAKLTRWGVDLHIGVLFGWINQLFLVLAGLALLMIIFFAYRAWFSYMKPWQTLYQCNHQLMHWWRRASYMQLSVCIVILIMLYFIVPVWAISIVLLNIFVAIHWLFLKDKKQS